jgi:hypothetical protein
MDGSFHLVDSCHYSPFLFELWSIFDEVVAVDALFAFWLDDELPQLSESEDEYKPSMVELQVQLTMKYLVVDPVADAGRVPLLFGHELDGLFNAQALLAELFLFHVPLELSLEQVDRVLHAMTICYDWAEPVLACLVQEFMEAALLSANLADLIGYGAAGIGLSVILEQVTAQLLLSFPSFISHEYKVGIREALECCSENACDLLDDYYWLGLDLQEFQDAPERVWAHCQDNVDRFNQEFNVMRSECCRYIR